MKTTKTSTTTKRTYRAHTGSGAWLCDVTATSARAAMRQVRAAWQIVRGDRVNVSEVGGSDSLTVTARR